MMKNLLNLGKALNRTEQKQVFGGDINRIKKIGDFCSDHYYAQPCPHFTSNSDGGCWVIELLPDC
ncbi:hypothetical protein [Winogradskyella flava]|uniref:Uncharacterized protein n=1 Tax=Winogradskyella flava TaxID=1884876 RepID=A0A842IUS1_9FLAO|nr:hypothetical protein [Winogradskyella flava]MBC2846535.1 hypothetical protein [Winogradskyella flava]